MELLPWIDKNRLYIPALNLNENAIDYLSEHYELIDLYFMVQNASFEVLPMHIQNNNVHPYIFLNTRPGIENILKDLEYSWQEWAYMCQNSRCINLIQKQSKYTYAWEYLSKNPKAIPLLLQNIEHINWSSLCINPCKEAIDLLMQYPDKIDWLEFSANPYAIDVIRQNVDKINYMGLYWNPCAIDLIETHMVNNAELPEIYWIGLSQNRNAIHILEKNKDKIDWCQLSFNPSIFEYNYKNLSVERMDILREELMQKTLHPSKIQYWLENGMSIDDLHD